MINLLKGVSTKLLVIVIAILSLSSFGLWKLYTGNLVEQGQMTSANETLQQNVTHVEQSAKITDTVVTDYATKAMQSQRDTDTLRKETINEYVKKIEPVVSSKETTKPFNGPDGADRVGILADRLHENYCRARPQDSRCSAVAPTK